MAKLVFKTPLSFPGIRDLHIDLTNALLSTETLTGTSPTVVSSDTSLVTVSATAVNTSILTNDDGTTSAVGKAVQWKATSVKASTGKMYFTITWAVAASGSADVHKIVQNLEAEITE